MDIRQALLEEHSKAQCRKIVNYIGSDKQKFEELMKDFLQVNTALRSGLRGL